MFLLAKASVFLTAVWGSTCVAHDGHVDDSKIHFHEIETKLKVAVSDFSATYFEGSVEGPLAETRSERSIVLLGGCSDPYGNIYISDADYPGFYCNQLTKSAYAFHPDDQTISRLPDMPEERTRHTAAFVDGRLYVIGGRGNQDELVKDVIVFDPELQQWNTFITLDDDHATSDHGTVARDGKIYVFGGWKANYESPKNETFSIDTRSNGKIEDLKPMMSQRGDIAAVHYKHGHIDAAFVIGGFGEEYCKPVATVERYFFDSNFWSESSNENLDLGVARGDKVAAVMDAKILVVAGEDKHEDLCDTPDLQPSVQAQAVDTVEVLDPLSKTPKWEVHPDFPVERFRSASAIDEKTNTLYVFGGQKSHNIDCDCYKTADEIYSYQGEQKKGGLSKAATGLIVTACVLLVAGVGFFYFRRTKRV